MKDKLLGIWPGQTVVCMASGPSLIKEDAEACRGMKTIVVNTTFRMAPWADMLFAMDTKWWEEHHKELTEFKGMKVCGSVGAKRYGAQPMQDRSWVVSYSNSGALAVSIALRAGASKIILLGYDCKYSPSGMRHWHGDHPKTLGNAKSIARWPALMDKAARASKDRGVMVINCSRDTALTCFERKPLAEAMCE